MNLSLPLFYCAEGLQSGTIQPLDEGTARHIGLVLRMPAGSAILLTDGQGHVAEATLATVTKKQVLVEIKAVSALPHAISRRVSIGIAPTKNTSRLEWFLEKACEMGVQEIYLLQTARTEKSHLRMDRLQQILVGAMLQSQQVHLPVLHALQPIDQVLSAADSPCRCMAHCMPERREELVEVLAQNPGSIQVLIGPEGDFTAAEWQQAAEHGFAAVSMGQTRLRTETAAMVAAALCCQV